jgi:hypothetical protein
MAAVDSPWITADFMTPSQRRKLCRHAGFEFQTLAALFRRNENDPPKLEHCGDDLEDNLSEEWPERTEEGDVAQLQQRRCDPGAPKQIKNEPGGVLTRYLWQIQTTKDVRHRHGGQQKHHESESAEPPPGACRCGPDRQQQQSDHT